MLACKPAVACLPALLDKGFGLEEVLPILGNGNSCRDLLLVDKGVDVVVDLCGGDPTSAGRSLVGDAAAIRADDDELCTVAAAPADCGGGGAPLACDPVPVPVFLIGVMGAAFVGLMYAGDWSSPPVCSLRDRCDEFVLPFER